MIWRSSGLYSYQPKIEMISTILLEKSYISGEDKIVIFYCYWSIDLPTSHSFRSYVFKNKFTLISANLSNC